MAALKFSLALGGKKAAAAPLKRKVALGGHDFDHEEVGEGRAQEISHFDIAAGGAIHEDHLPKAKAPLVIKGPSNRDWREASRRKRQKTALPGDGRGEQDIPEGELRENGAPKSYGLNIMAKDDEDGESNDTANGQPAPEGTDKEPQMAMTDDERALAALLGNQAKSDLVLPHIESEEQVFDRDYEKAPDAPTLEEYDATPIDQFGAGLLRGMGWKDGEPIGKRGQAPPKPTVVERRPALLGIGAKQDAAVGVELGAWGKGAKGKKKLEQDYTPVLLENKKTGEKLTEEELKARIENQRMVASEQQKDRSRHGSDRDYDSSSKRRKQRDGDDYDSRNRDNRRRNKHRNEGDYNSRDKGGRRRDEDRDYDDRKHRSSRRDGSSSSERRHRGKKDNKRDSDDRNHHSSRRDRSLSTDSRDRSRKDREKHRKYDEDRHRSSRHERSRSRDRHDRKERKDGKEKHRDREDRYEIAA